MRVLIIGGTGLMGPHLVKQLTTVGYECICLNRSGTNQENGLTIQTDRRNQSELEKAILSSAPDLVIDMIPYTEEDAVGLAKALKSTNLSLLAISSIDVYRAFDVLHRQIEPPYQNCPINENDELRNTLGMHGKGYDKLNIEKRYLDLPNDVTIFRMPAIYGWPDKSRIQPYLEQYFKTGQIALRPDIAKWKFSRGFNVNCAHAIHLGIHRSGKHIYNVAEELALSEEAWCHRIISATGQDGPIVISEDATIEHDCTYAQDWYVDTSKIRGELGYTELVDPIRAVEETVGQYMATHHLP